MMTTLLNRDIRTPYRFKIGIVFYRVHLVEHRELSDLSFR